MPDRDTVLPGDEDERFFRENGYWVAPRFLDDARLDALRDRMDRVYAGIHETGRAPWAGGWRPGNDLLELRKTDNAHWSDGTIAALATDPLVGHMAARLLGVDTIRLWHDQLLYKPGGGSASGNVGWHQDYAYWRCADVPDLVTAWVAFDDVDERNGCMMAIPGSHAWGLLEEGDFFERDLDALESRIRLAAGGGFRKVPLRLPAGAASFHHALTVHGSGPNATDRPRRSLVVHMMAGHVRYRAGSPNDNHMNVSLLAGRDGDPFAGPAFPVLWTNA